MLGRKGIEPLTALAIEFTAQPVIPTNGTFLFIFFSPSPLGKGEGRMGVLLIFINPVQLPLHEPYFDLTLISVTHTKIT